MIGCGSLTEGSLIAVGCEDSRQECNEENI